MNLFEGWEWNNDNKKYHIVNISNEKEAEKRVYFQCSKRLGRCSATLMVGYLCCKSYYMCAGCHLCNYCHCMHPCIAVATAEFFSLSIFTRFFVDCHSTVLLSFPLHNHSFSFTAAGIYFGVNSIKNDKRIIFTFSVSICRSLFFQLIHSLSLSLSLGLFDSFNLSYHFLCESPVPFRCISTYYIFKINRIRKRNHVESIHIQIICIV